MTEISLSHPLVCFDRDFTEPDRYKLATGIVTVFSSRAPGKETANEDSLAVIPVNDKAIVLAVADGLGGLPAGEMASRIVMEELKASLEHAGEEDLSLRAMILDGIELANEKILSLRSGSATTLVVAEIQDRSLRTYHAGDSMIVLMGNKGKVKYSTIPHSPTGYALESGLIDETEAMQHDERHLISNFIGIPDMRVEIGPIIPMAARDTLLLASDGLADNLYEDEIIEAVRKGPLFRGTTHMLSEARANMLEHKPDRKCHPDDLTCITYRLS